MKQAEVIDKFSSLLDTAIETGSEADEKAVVSFIEGVKSASHREEAFYAVDFKKFHKFLDIEKRVNWS